MPDPRQELEALRKAPENVKEAWPIYDTLILSPIFYGAEDQNRGWFTSFANFAGQESHSFLNSRTEATASLAYCNKMTSDSMDFAYELYSIGCAFFAPTTRILGQGPTATDTPLDQMNSHIAHYWETVLPRHCSFELKIQQDVVWEGPAMSVPPGYGPCGGGATFEHERVGRVIAQGLANPDYMAVANMNVTQGVPSMDNRMSVWAESPIGIPRTGIVEAVVRVSEIARRELSQLGFNPYLMFGGVDAADPGDYNMFPARFGIQVSLLGKRMVQQRGNYHV